MKTSLILHKIFTKFTDFPNFKLEKHLFLSIFKHFGPNLDINCWNLNFEKKLSTILGSILDGWGPGKSKISCNFGLKIIFLCFSFNFGHEVCPKLTPRRVCDTKNEKSTVQNDLKGD